MVITWADVTAAFPKDAALAAITTPAEQEGPLVAANSLNGCVFGVREKYARVLVAAHYATLGLGQSVTGGGGTVGYAGAITSERVGGISRSYGVNGGTATGASWGATTYGQRYLDLVRTSRARWPVVM